MAATAIKQAVAGNSLGMALIMGKFHAFGIAQSEIHCGSTIKTHKCIFAALSLQVFVLDKAPPPSESYRKKPM